MAEKILQTRIITKHADWETWQSSNLELKEGEIVLAKVTTNEADPISGRIKEVPAFIAKVGNGTTFANTPWMYAKAVDVYGWAKKANLDVADIPTLEMSKINGLATALEGKVNVLDYGTDQSNLAIRLSDIDSSISDESTARLALEARVKTIEDAPYATKGYVDLQTGLLQSADGALDTRLGDVEAKLETISNVMDFLGTRTVEVVDDVIVVTPIDNETFNKGDVVVDTTGKEYVYDGNVWREFGYADANATAIADHESRIGQAELNIGTLQTTVANKLDTTTAATTYETISNVNLVREDVAQNVSDISDLKVKVGTLEGASANHISVGTDNKMYLGEDVIIFDCGGAE